MSKRPLRWMGPTKKDVTSLPEDVKRVMGFCLHKLQEGEFDERIEQMTGNANLRQARVVEIRDNFGGDTFRTMAAIKFPEAIYVLHVFKKKSHKGKETPQKDIDTIIARLTDVRVLRKARGYAP
jgi:phage-related protein